MATKRRIRTAVIRVQRWTENTPTTVLSCQVCQRPTPDLSKSDAGALLEISPASLDRLLAEGKLHYIRPDAGDPERVCVASILAYRGSLGGRTK